MKHTDIFFYMWLRAVRILYRSINYKWDCSDSGLLFNPFLWSLNQLHQTLLTTVGRKLIHS